jgi:uncharacterized protein
MKDLLEFVVKNIVEDTDKVVVDESEEGGIIMEKITVSDGEIGKIIGKGGKVIKSLRTLTKIYSLKQGQKFYLEIAEPKSDDDTQA